LLFYRKHINPKVLRDTHSAAKLLSLIFIVKGFSCSFQEIRDRRITRRGLQKKKKKERKKIEKKR